jgi:outer membrane protein OmpA-like peptidoglycan-associated protein
MRTPSFLFLLLLLSQVLTAQNAKKQVTLPDWKVTPIALSALNSPQRDVNLSITPNGRYLYFMSGRGLQTWSNPNYTTFKGQPEADGDVWYAERNNNVWKAPVCLQAPVNTSMGEDEPNISADGQTVYFESWRNDWMASGGPYYQAELHGNQWSQPYGLGSGISQFFQYSRYATDGMSVAPNGRIMVIASGPNYDGPMDIFISRKDQNGQWSVPQKLDISTPYDERSVFIGADSKTLYFASNGWGGFGKLDIFKTTLEGGTTTGELINIGKPFNTKDDDYGFILDAPRNDVFFVREGDIFYANLGATIDERIKPKSVLIINGLVKEKGKGFLEANLFMRHDESDEIMGKARSNSASGEYSMSLPKFPGEYTLRVNFLEGYPPIEKKVIIDAATPDVLEISFEVDPTPQEVTPIQTEAPAPKVVIAIPSSTKKATILFHYGQAILTDSSKVQLQEIAALCKTAKQYTLSLVGHTDDSGSNGFNQKLSERRVKAVADFFRSQGLTCKIDAKGEQAPMVANDNDVHKAQNRRVEVILELE